MTRKHVFIAFAIALTAVALLGIWSLRRPLVAAAEADLQARGVRWFEVTGTRIPCDGPLSIGVTATFRRSADGLLIGARLCRPLDWSSPWSWYPDPDRAYVK